MATRDELLALAARAEAGADAGLSDDVWRALGWKNVTNTIHSMDVWETPNGSRLGGPRPDLRVSLDAVEEVPGRIVHVDRDSQHVWFAEASQIGGPQGIGGTECLARLAAKLRALAAAQKESGGE